MSLALSSFGRLLGREIDVDLNAGIFVTLNPAGKKYGGRSKLPDNLKALFRPVAMGRPDNELIAEVRDHARVARRVTACFEPRLPSGGGTLLVGSVLHKTKILQANSLAQRRQPCRRRSTQKKYNCTKA